MALGNKFSFIKKGLSSIKDNGVKSTYYKTVTRKKQEDAVEFMRAIMFSDVELINQRRVKFPNAVTVSVLVRLYNTEKNNLKSMIESVLEQTYSDWQLCLFDNSDDEHTYVGEMISEYTACDDRIVYLNAKEIDLTLCAGEYIALLCQDDMLSPNALFETMKQVEQGADFIYFDEEIFQGDILNPTEIIFKPDFAPDTIASSNYISNSVVIKKVLLNEIGGFGNDYNGNENYDLILRATDKAQSIVHIPKVLYHKRKTQTPQNTEFQIKALQNHLPDADIKHIGNQCYSFKYKIKNSPIVSVIVVANGSQKELEECLNSLITENTYENTEFIVADVNRTIGKNDTVCSKFADVKHIKYNGKYNYSAVVNNAVMSAKGEYILFCDAENTVLTKGYIEEMLMYAQRKNTASVGAKITHANQIYSAGYIIGLHDCIGSAFYGTDKNDVGYMNKLITVQNYSAVSSSFMMISKDKFKKAEMFSTEYANSLMDADMCLKQLDLGYVNVYTPFVEVNHNGGNSVNEFVNKNDKQLFKEIWSQEFKKGDRYYNVNLSLMSDDFSL